MSCGQPHETECNAVLDALCAYMDNEATALDRELIAAHLVECSPCENEFVTEKLVKGLVNRACCEDKAPQAIRVNVQAIITRIQADFTTGS